MLDPQTVYELVWSGELRSPRVAPSGRSIRVSEARLASHIDRNAQGVLARR